MPGFMENCEKAVQLSGRLLLDKLGTVSVREKGPSDLVPRPTFRPGTGGADGPGGLPGPYPDRRRNPAALSKAGRRAAGQKPLYRWIVDPLDGTTDYVHQVPHFSVSLALEYDGRILVGAVYNPAGDECLRRLREGLG